MDEILKLAVRYKQTNNDLKKRTILKLIRINVKAYILKEF